MRHSRRSSSFFAAALAALCLLAACSTGENGASGDKNARLATLWVVLLDRSESAKADASIHEEAVKRLVGAVRPGDRFVMASITGTSGNDFRVSMDVALPDAALPQGLTDDPVEYRRRKAAIDEGVSAAMNRIAAEAAAFTRQEAKAQKSAIFESILVAAPLMLSDRRHRVLVLLSDMLEDSNGNAFERTPPSDASTQREIARQQRLHTLPDLKGVTVCVAGATASPPERAAAVERFWRSYFEAAGAVVPPGAYARTLTGCVN